jgi:hypothetical protein
MMFISGMVMPEPMDVRQQSTIRKKSSLVP